CTMPDAAVVCALPARLFGSRVVLDVHDTMPELYRDKFPGRRGRIGERLLKFEERASTWFAHRVLAVHDLHRVRLENAGVTPGKIHVVVNTPDARIFVADRTGHQPKPEFTIVCHGTVARRLGLDVAIYAMIALRERVPEARLLLIGAGDYLEEA